MMPRISPVMRESKTAWNKVRGPLHKVISHGELVAEEAEEQSALHLQATIAHVLNSCEALLRNTKDDSPAVERVLHDFSELENATRALNDLDAHGLADSLRHDINSISNNVAALGSLFRTVKFGTAASEFPACNVEQKSASAVDRLIVAELEYRGLLLVVDDDEDNREVLSRRLLRDGYEVMLAESGRQALRMLNRYHFDLVLLDIMMPGIDGVAVLEEVKKNPQLDQLPIVMISAVDEIDTIAHCIQLGADDYLLKPFNSTLLQARVSALLDRKRLQDEQQRQHQELQTILEDSRRQAERSEKLLLNILPAAVAQELVENGSVRPMYFEDVTIVFADIVGFTLSTERMPADELVECLHVYFTRCDDIVARYGLEKLKTIGDCYMFAGGLPARKPSHPVDSVLAATEMLTAMAEISHQEKLDWQLRIGIHTGSVIAGVVGIHKFAFDVWGESVNFASRVEACGAAGRINLSLNTFARVKDFFDCERREHLRIKEGKEVEMFFLNGIAASLSNKVGMSRLSAFRKRYSTFFRSDLNAWPTSLFESDPLGDAPPEVSSL